MSNPDNLASAKIESEAQRKHFFLDLKENDRGRVLRIKEVSSNGRVNIVMIPGDVLKEFAREIDSIITFD